MNCRLFFLCSIWLSGAAFAAPPDIPVTIVGAEFGIFDASNPKEIVFQPTAVVPHVEGQRYGWAIEVQTKKRSLSVREEYLLPTQATRDGPTGDLQSSGMTIPLPRRNQVSQRQLVPVGGMLYGEWSVGPGEPAGKRHLQVIVEGEIAGSFEYEVK